MSPNPAVLTWPRPVAAAAGGVSYITFENYGYEPGRTSWTFSDVELGAAATGRVIVVAITARLDSSTFTIGATVGGVTATEDVSSANNNLTAVFRAVVPTGTAGDIVVTSSVTGKNCAVAVYSIAGYSVAVEDLGVDTDGEEVTLTPARPGLIVACANSNSAGTSFTWSGIDEDYDGTYSGSFSVSGGHIETTSASDVTVTAARSGGIYARLAAVAYSLT